MKQVRLSRAFGTTPKTVYRRMEHAFTLPPEAAKGQEAEVAELPRRPLFRWRFALIALAAVLLGITAILALEPFRSGKDTRGALMAEVQLSEVRVELRKVSATADEVRATAEFSLGTDQPLHYFWYNGTELPDGFQTDAADNGRPAYYVFCALGWQEAESMTYSDLASAQQAGPSRLNVLMSGAWQAESGPHEVICYITAIRADATGAYRQQDVQKAVLPVTVIVE